MRHDRAIRLGTRNLIEVTKKTDNFWLNDTEKLTLFNNACKLLITYSKNAFETWDQMCEYGKLCGVDFFEMKDKRGHGIELRFAKNWPIKN